MSTYISVFPDSGNVHDFADPGGFTWQEFVWPTNDTPLTFEGGMAGFFNGGASGGAYGYITTDGQPPILVQAVVNGGFGCGVTLGGVGKSGHSIEAEVDSGLSPPAGRLRYLDWHNNLIFVDTDINDGDTLALFWDGFYTVKVLLNGATILTVFSGTDQAYYAGFRIDESQTAAVSSWICKTGVDAEGGGDGGPSSTTFGDAPLRFNVKDAPSRDATMRFKVLAPYRDAPLRFRVGQVGMPAQVWVIS